MNLVYSDKKVELEGSTIQVANISDFEKYLQCFKDSVFDAFYAEVNEKDIDYFINIKNITRITNLVKKGLLC